jgi:cell division protein ZapA (FtsZ GTPase activity inhibitor)
MKSVRIRVLNNDYFIKTDADEEYVQQIASFLEKKIKETFPQVGSVLIPRPFLLATLKVVDDYFRLKREFEEFRSRAEEKSRRLVEMLDSSFEEERRFDNQDRGEKKGEEFY